MNKFFLGLCLLGALSSVSAIAAEPVVVPNPEACSVAADATVEEIDFFRLSYPFEKRP